MPVVMCPGCYVAMVLSRLEPSETKPLQRAYFHCRQCGADTMRVFVADS
jgi:hypothetical protein